MRLNFGFHIIIFLILNVLEHLLQYFTDVHSLEEKNPGFLAVLNILKLFYWSTDISHKIEFELKVGFRDIKQ